MPKKKIEITTETKETRTIREIPESDEKASRSKDILWMKGRSPVNPSYFTDKQMNRKKEK